MGKHGSGLSGAQAADDGPRVRTAVQTQHSAVDQAILAIEQIAMNSRSVAATAQEIAAAASRQDELASDFMWSTAERDALREETARGA